MAQLKLMYKKLPNLILIIGGFLISMLLSACLYTKPKVPTLNVPNSFKAANQFTSPNLNPKWWLNFHDPNLEQLVTLAFKNNLNYLIALKNIQIARTYVTENASSFFPQLGLNAGTSRNRQSLNNLTGKALGTNPIYNQYQLNGTVSYEIDIWSRIRNSVESAKASVKVSIADSNVVKLSLLSNLANAYWQLAALNINLSNLNEQSSITQQMVRLNQIQYNSGLIDIEPMANAKTQLENINSNISNLEKQCQILRNTLAYLIGTYPEHFACKIEKMASAVDLTQLIPKALPAKILVNRPDIQSAFYQVLAYGYAEKQTLAAFLPTFTITGAYGFASSGLKNLTAGGSEFWNFGAGAIQTLFDFAKNISQHKRAKLQYEAAVLNYKNVVLNAFQEVNSALASYQQDYLALKSMQNTLKLANEKLASAHAQYRAGVINYPTYLSYKLTYLQSQYDLTSQTNTVITDTIQVYKTLGLGI